LLAESLRLLKCNILSIPKMQKPVISNIWAGTDFSSASNKVLRKWLKAYRKNTAKVKAIRLQCAVTIFSLYSKEHLDTKIEKIT
jgi:hypothetical protein